MNTKNVLLIILAFAAYSLVLRAQSLPKQLLQAGNGHWIEGKEVRFPASPVRVKPQVPRDVNFLLPEKTYWYYIPDFETPFYEVDYIYDVQQILKTVLWTPTLQGVDAVKDEYNHTLTIDGLDMLDTITYYSDAAMTRPRSRKYYNWKLYELSPIDSFYYEEVWQLWNTSTEEWNNNVKYYYGFIDTIMWENNRVVKYAGFGTDGWSIENSCINTDLFYDDNGFIIGLLQDRQSGSSYGTFKHVYVLNDDGSVRSDSIFRVYADEPLVLWYTAEHEWLEWHGFGEVRSMISVVGADGLYYERPWMQLRNKPTSQTYYLYQHGVKKFIGQNKKTWYTGPHYSSIDSVFLSKNNDGVYENRYLSNIVENRYDEYGNYTMYKSVAFDTTTGNHHEITNVFMNITHYHYTDYGYNIGCDSITYWNGGLSAAAPQTLDSTLIIVEKVVRYVVSVPEYLQQSQTLQLAPNPATNSVWVSANEELESIALFDLSGRQLRVEEKLNTTNAALSLEGIPAGVYIVRGKTKQGFYQVGKLVKN